MKVRSTYYLDIGPSGQRFVRSHRDPSWFCDVTLFLADPYGAYSDAAKSAIRAALNPYA